MKIGIIGAGHIGNALTRRFLAVGHDVEVANAHGPDSLADFARDTGALAVSIEAAAQGNDVVVLAIPMNGVENLPPRLFAKAAADLVIINTGNYYPQQRDGRIDAIEAGQTEAGWVEERIGHPVVKAFNNIAAAHILDGGKPPGTAGRIALPVAGDDPKAKAAAMQLIGEIGFDAVDAGSIDDSWRQQPSSPGYSRDYDLAGTRRALSEARDERAPEWRATANSPGTYAVPA